MITYHVGNLFHTDKHVIGHGVNCVKNMNSGIAHTIKNMFPEVFEAFMTKDFLGGDIQAVTTNNGQFTVLNIATQINGGANANLQFIEYGIRNSFEWVVANGYEGFAIPRIGAGVGGLEWEDVNEVMSNVSKEYPNIELEIWIRPEDL